MTLARRGLVLLAVQLVLVGLLYGRLATERAMALRVWARAVPIDPLDPFRGRYVRLWLEAQDRRADPADSSVRLAVEEGRLVALSAPPGEGFPIRQAEGGTVLIDHPVALFIPEHIPDPSLPTGGRELWVEVTVRDGGLPRPIRFEHRATSPELQ